jgi:site-specific recombinase XerD
MPAHHTLEAYLDACIDATGIVVDRKGPLFRTAPRTNAMLTQNPMSTADVWRMIRRRLAYAGIRTLAGCRSFRATGITCYLENKGTLEKAQQMASHSSPRTTKLYDRTNDQVTLDEVEKIVI